MYLGRVYQYTLDQRSDSVSATVTQFSSSTTEPLRYVYASQSPTSFKRIYVYNDPLGNPINPGPSASGTNINNNVGPGPFYIGYLDIGASQTNYYYGEAYEILVFNKSLYDLDGTTGTNVPVSVQTIYNNQLGYISLGSILSMTGIPLFSQLSSAAQSSAVGAFSLRAVNGRTALAVNVVQGGAFPIAGFSGPIQSGNTFTQTLTGPPFTGSYTANCSSFYGISEEPWRAFDKILTGHGWTASGTPYNPDGTYKNSGTASTTISSSVYVGEWIQIKFPFTVLLTSYTIYTVVGDITRAPNTFKLAGSNDGITWTLVDTQSGITWGSPYNTTFTPSTQITLYSYYRLCVNKNNGSGFLSITELIINGTTSATQDFYADRLGNLLTAPVTGQTLSSWLGGATGYVATWYDQSGQGNHATQTNLVNQPQINLTTSPYSLLFTGSQYFQNTVPFTFNFGTNYQYSIRTIVNNTGGCIFYKGLLNAPNSTNGEKAWYMGQTSGGLAAGNYPNHVGTGEGKFNGTPPITSSKTSVTWSSSAYNTLALYENTSSATATSSGRTAGNSDPGSYFYIGNTFATIPYYTGNIYEIEIFSSTLGTSDVTIMG